MLEKNKAAELHAAMLEKEKMIEANRLKKKEAEKLLEEQRQKIK